MARLGIAAAMSRPRQRLSATEAAKLWPEVPISLLQALHLVGRDGVINADAHRKLKQVKHLLQLAAPAVEDALARHTDPVVVDFGAGKSYLGLLLAQTLLRPAGRGRLIAVESRPDLCSTAERVAREAGLSERVSIVTGDIATAELPSRIHVVTALHACDTATDDALLRGLALNADHMVVVPCCQAEVAQLLKEHKAKGPWSELSRHPLHRREFGAHVTNVLRALTLEANGYQTTVTELVGWEHSVKNELILGRRVHRENREAKQRLSGLLEELGVKPRIVSAMASPPV